MIYYDVSESRDNTRLSEAVVKAGVPVVGLEAATGADLLISPREGLPSNVNKAPGSKLLPLFIENSFLIQRKSGTDFLQSIPKLSGILWRMRVVSHETTCRPWLLICGNMTENNDGFVVMDGRVTGWKWAHVAGVLETWQLYGGFISQNPTDDQCANTIIRWNENIGQWAEFVEEGKFIQKIEVPKLQWQENPWRSTLMTFPGCGDIMSDNIAKYCNRLVESLIWMSETTSFGVPGVGKKTLERFRAYLGLKETEHIIIINDSPTGLDDLFGKSL